jgi:hypothetical protein
MSAESPGEPFQGLGIPDTVPPPWAFTERWREAIAGILRPMADKGVIEPDWEVSGRWDEATRSHQMVIRIRVIIAPPDDPSPAGS